MDTQYNVLAHFNRSFNSETTEVTIRLSRRNQVLTALKDAGGESLSVSDISEATGLSEQAVSAQLKVLCNAKSSARCVWEDETQKNHYSYESSIIDKLVIGS